MHDDDFESFVSMLDTISGMISRNRYQPSAEHASVFFAALKHYPLPTVSAAFTAHLRDPERGKFAPTPADIVAKIEASLTNSRPGAEEAWAMIPEDESETIVWTAEMAEAHAACSRLIAEGDRVAARMAFKEVYTRAVTRAVAAGQPVSWSASLGWDMEKRARTLAAAVEAGKLPALAARDECPVLPLTKEERLSLPAPSLTKKQSYREQMKAFRDSLTQEKTDPKA